MASKITLKFLKNAAEFSASEECYQKSDFFKIKMPFQNIFLVNDAEVLQHILVKNEKNYTKSKIYWQELKAVIGDAMGSLDGDEWLTLRKLQNQFFTKISVQQYSDYIAEKTDEFTENLDGKFSPAQKTAELNIEIVLSQVFGVDEKVDAKTIHQYIENGEELIAWRSKFPWRKHLAFLHPKQKNAKRDLIELQKMTDKFIKNNQKEKLLFELKNSGYSNQHIRNELIIHLGAGTETVAVANTWTLFLLTQHPRIFEKVKKEIHENSSEKILAEGLPKFKFLEKCIKESLRLFPPSHALVRDALRKDEIKNISIKRSDILYISAFGIHRNPKYWEQPTQFIPERFDDEKNFKDYTYIPFGAGKHSCIGKYLAMPLMIFTLANLIKKYEIECLTENPKPVSLSTLKPDREIIFELKKLKPQKAQKNMLKKEVIQKNSKV